MNRFALFTLLAAAPLVAWPASPADPVEDARLAIRTKQFSQAVALLNKYAAGGSAEAQYLLGLAAANGIGMQTDIQAARESLERAARQEHARAAYALAALLAQGTSQQRQQATDWVRRAADAGYTPAMAALAAGRLPLFDPRAAAVSSVELRFAIARSAARNDDLELWRALKPAELLARRDEFGRTMLLIAAQSGARETTRELLQAGADVNAADEFGTTPLMLAARQRDEEITGLLLGAGARVASTDRAGRAALAHAAAADQAGQVRRLLAAGARLDALDSQGASATDVAQRREATTALEVLRAAGGRVTLPAATRSAGVDFGRAGLLYRGWQPLLIAVARDDAGDLRQRVAGGESIAARTPQGESALQVAVAAHAAQSLRALLELGADARAREGGRNAIQRIALSGDAVLIQTLDEVLALTATERALLFGAAVDRGDAPLVRLLLAHGASAVDRDAGGVSPLMRAVRAGNLEFVRLFLDRGADPGAGDSRGRNALWYAAAARQAAAVDLLLSMHVSVDAADRDGATPLIAAIRAGDKSIVLRLLAAGAAVNGDDRRHDVPLRVAAELGDAAIVAALLARDPDVNATDGFGETALIAAARRGHEAVCIQLVQAGANARLRGRDRATAADIAEARGFASLAQRLRS